LVNTKKRKNLILGCPRPKFFFSGLPNLLPQKIRLPLISFFFGGGRDDDVPVPKLKKFGAREGG